ncbi:MAG: hypothetical protein M3Y77_07120 [Actinomycetota bacterium]|nr:hypothetical protein [Actinomycetota bacterium]
MGPANDISPHHNLDRAHIAKFSHPLPGSRTHASDLRIDDHYGSRVVLTEPCESSSPSIRGGFSSVEPWMQRPVQPTCNTTVAAASSYTTW